MKTMGGPETIQYRTNNRDGFTIVELLIVIVVIAILATIIIVAYNGIQQRAIVSTMASDLDNTAKSLKLYQVDNSSYPTSNDCSASPAANSICLKSSSGTTYTTFTQNNTTSPQTFCVTAMNGTNSYYINQDGTPQSGGCNITNFVTNPNIETSITGLSGPNSSTVSRDTSRAQGGSTASLLVTMPIDTAGRVGATLAFLSNAVPTVMKPNTQYVISAYVYVPTGTGDVQITAQGAGVAIKANGSNYTASVKDSWVRISNVITTSSGGGTVIMYVLNKLATSPAGTQFWVDNTMITEGPVLYNYADGSSTGWSWTIPAQPNNSSSSGPQP
jgi:prepilin-type N-terminal cleavage/methylation domain-containing protein